MNYLKTLCISIIIMTTSLIVGSQESDKENVQVPSKPYLSGNLSVLPSDIVEEIIKHLRLKDVAKLSYIDSASHRGIQPFLEQKKEQLRQQQEYEEFVNRANVAWQSWPE